MTRALLWKDIRLNTDVFTAGATLLVASFPLAMAGVYVQGVSPFPWASALAAGCVLNQYTLVLTCALLGATALAREREDGSSRFLAYLPAERGPQLTTKLAVGLSATFCFWGINVLLLMVSLLLSGAEFAQLSPFVPRMLGVGLLSLVAFGASWLLAFRIASPVGAAFTGLGAPGILCAAWLVWKGQSPEPPVFFDGPFLFLLTAMASLSILAGVLRFLRRDPWCEAAPGRTVSCAAGSVPHYAETRTGRGPMLALIWKDFRLLKPLLFGGAAVLAVPFAVAIATALNRGEAAPAFRTASLAELALCWLILPCWAGQALATESATSAGRFLAYLPVTRRRVLLSKLAIALFPSLSLCAAGFGVFLLAEQAIPGEPSLNAALTWEELNESGFLSGAIAYACASPVAFGVAWFASSRLRRPVPAIVLGVLAAPAAMAAWAIPSMPDGYIVTNYTPLQAMTGFTACMALLTAFLIGAGCTVFSRRDERGGAWE